MSRSESNPQNPDDSTDRKFDPATAADPSAALDASGLYKRKSRGSANTAADPGDDEEAANAGERAEGRTAALAFEREELRLDVDGRYPQMTVSGTLRRRFAGQIHWIADLTATGSDTWTGQIWYKDGKAGIFPYTDVRVRAVRSAFPNLRRAIVRLSGGGAPPRRRRFRFASPYFHKAEFEYDREQGVQQTLEIDSCGHPNRPASLPCETLKIETVFRRAGFKARRSSGIDVIPNDGPDPNGTWSDAEMHDAMQSYWSRFANRPRWALWVLFANQHDDGPGLGGIMFDDIGPNHRQGTAVFTDSFISDPPLGEPDPADWVKRMHFWTAVHEMGHAFNLAHSWQKHLGTPWIPLAPEPEARSFMNYPYGVAGGETAFFADFEFRFSDGELLFMRHAPKRFVQMGNADWFDHHGFEESVERPSRDFQLEIGVDRQKPDYEFLEPVVLELKLTNTSGQPKVVPADLLADSEHMVVIVKKDGRPARRWSPYAVYCHGAEKTVLGPGESMTESLFVSAGRNGPDIAEPGYYTVQMAMEVEGGDVVSEPQRLRVAPPRSYDEEFVAQDVFADDAGRVMAFDGSMVLEAGNDAWQELVERLPKSKAAVHAQVALALPKIRNYRVLQAGADEEAVALGGKSAFRVSEAKVEESRRALEKALLADPAAAMATLGRVDYEYYCGRFREGLATAGGEKYAKKVDEIFRKVARGRGARPSVKGRAGAGKTRA